MVIYLYSYIIKWHQEYMLLISIAFFYTKKKVASVAKPNTISDKFFIFSYYIHGYDFQYCQDCILKIGSIHSLLPTINNTKEKEKSINFAHLVHISSPLLAVS